MPRIVFLNGEFLPADEAKISIFDRAVTFGDAIYDVAGVLDGKLVDFDNHMQRYFSSLKRSASSHRCRRSKYSRPSASWWNSTASTRVWFTCR